MMIACKMAELILALYMPTELGPGIVNIVRSKLLGKHYTNVVNLYLLLNMQMHSLHIAGKICFQSSRNVQVLTYRFQNIFTYIAS